MIYFIRSGGYIKIGVSNNPWKRMSTLQTANPEPLEMLAIAPGDYAFETELNGLFSKYHHSGEWFVDNDRIRSFAGFMYETFPDLQKPQRLGTPSEDTGINFITDDDDYEVPIEYHLETVARVRRNGGLLNISTRSLHDIGISRFTRRPQSPASAVLEFLISANLIRSNGDRKPYSWTREGKDRFPSPLPRR